LNATVKSTPAMSAVPAGWRLFIPKLVLAFQEGYGARDFRADLFAGLTVAIVALPLSMALAIASGVTPERGLFTAVVAGFFISALGGSRYQIGGPTGAFVVVVFNVVQKFGYDGLVVATIMAGCMLMAAGVARLGTFIKYVPYPVVTGFTSGIAIIIFTSQVGDILGLRLAHLPGDVFGKWQAYFSGLGTFNGAAIAVAFGALATILLLRRYAPRAPGFLIAIALASLTALVFHLNIETIGTRFGGLPNMLPAPHCPAMNLAEIRALVPSAFTIFVLGGIESLLSAVVADGMTGRRHRSNLELVAQGIANIASACMGGIPATGAIARTATNIRAGARSPMAGIIHAATILVLMAAFAPYASFIPLAALGAVLVTVCWNMAEIGAFRSILSGPVGDRVVLIATFGLTVFVDLSVAIAIGMVMAAFLFMHRMAEAVEAETHLSLIEKDDAPDNAVARDTLPPGVEVFQLHGPFFFGAAAHFEQVLTRAGGKPKVIILNMEDVPLIDATGAATLNKFLNTTRAKGTRIILCGMKAGPAATLKAMAVTALSAPDMAQAIAASHKLIAK